MASDTEDPDLAAERLEAALERIAEAGARAQANALAAPVPSSVTPEVGTAAEADPAALIGELDAIIARLRTVLGAGRG